jgi:hypothetical protein
MEWHRADADELRSMIKDHILPRLDQLENEVTMLRSVCWPVCQALRENGQLADIHSKAIFLSHMHPQDMARLVLDKAKVIRKLKLGSADCTAEEMRLVSRT